MKHSGHEETLLTTAALHADWGVQAVDTNSDEQTKQLANQQRVLSILFCATGGYYWSRRNQWLSTTEGISSWEGVSCDSFGNVVGLRLDRNNLTGTRMIFP